MGPKNSTREVKAHRHVMGEDGKRHWTMPEAHRPKNVKPKQPKDPETGRKKQKLRSKEEIVSIKKKQRVDINGKKVQSTNTPRVIMGSAHKQKGQ